MRAQQEVDRLAGLVDRAVKILPLASNLDVGRVHAPAQPDGALAPTKHQRQHRQHLDRPPVNRRVVDGDAALSHHLLKVAQAQQIRRIPAHALQHDFQRVVQSIDNLAQRVVHGLRRGFRHLLTIADTRYCNRTLVNVKRPEQGKMKDVAFVKPRRLLDRHRRARSYQECRTLIRIDGRGVSDAGISNARTPNGSAQPRLEFFAGLVQRCARGGHLAEHIE